MCFGDEKGTGGGVLSHTHNGACWPKTWSETVRFQGRNAVRHDDVGWHGTLQRRHCPKVQGCGGILNVGRAVDGSGAVCGPLASLYCARTRVLPRQITDTQPPKLVDRRVDAFAFRPNLRRRPRRRQRMSPSVTGKRASASVCSRPSPPQVNFEASAQVDLTPQKGFSPLRGNRVRGDRGSRTRLPHHAVITRNRLSCLEFHVRCAVGAVVLRRPSRGYDVLYGPFYLRSSRI